MSLPSNGSLSLSEINRSVSFTNGNVGIGTSTPDSKLHLYDSSALAINTKTTSAQTQLWSFNDTKTYFQSSGDIEFTGVGSTTLRHLYLATSGNVGINTINPRIRLHVEGNSVLGNSDGDVIGGNLYWNGSAWTRGNSNVTGFGLRIGSTSNGNGMQIVTMDTANGFANRMLVGANGNVGINTTNPAQRLEVSGRIRVSQTGAVSAVYEMRNAAGIAYLFNNPSGSVHLFPVNNTSSSLILGADETGITGGSIGIATSNPNSFANLHVNGDILLSTGRSLWITGIGDTAGNRLRVQNNNTQSNIDFMGGALVFRGGNTLSNLMVMNTNGNLGIGTITATERLTVNGTTDIYGSLRVATNSTSAGYTINLGTTGVGGFRSGIIYGDGSNMGISNQQPGILRFHTDNDGNKCFIVGSTGNVSIGTSTQIGKFTVHSSSYPNVTLTTDDNFVNAIDFNSSSKTGGKLWRVASSHQSAGEGQGKFFIENRTDGRPPGFCITGNNAVAMGTFFPANLGLHITNGTNGQLQLGPSSSGGFHIWAESGQLRFYSSTWGAGIEVGRWTTSGLTVLGALSKGSGSFDIQHPLHPDDVNKRLVHSFIEGPRCDLIYRGQVTLTNGTATVNLDTDCVAEQECGMTLGTFEALCANPQFHLENENFSRVIGTLQDNVLTIQCEDPTSTDTVYWTVIAERKDNFIKSWERTNTNGYLVTEYTKIVVQE